ELAKLATSYGLLCGRDDRQIHECPESTPPPLTPSGAPALAVGATRLPDATHPAGPRLAPLTVFMSWTRLCSTASISQNDCRVSEIIPHRRNLCLRPRGEH